jgi:hypothetical protein
LKGIRKRTDLSLQLPLDLFIFSVMLFAIFNGNRAVLMLLWLPDMLLNRLNTSLVMVLVYFAVDGDGLLNGLNGDDGLLGDCRFELLANLGVVLTVTMADDNIDVSFC